MSSKLSGNGLFEGSRFILPEHAARIREQYIEETRKEKPVLDDQEMQLIEQALVDSYNQRQPVELQLFDPYQDVRVTGIVTVLNSNRREVKLLQGEDEYTWIKLEQIISAHT